MKKRVLSLVLTFCMLLGLLPAAAQGTTEEQGAPPRTPCSETAGCSLEAGHEGECVLYETMYSVSVSPTGDVTWSYGALADACKNVCPNGAVIVLRDIELEEGVTITKPLTLFSNTDNPCTITYSPKDRGDYLLTAQASGQMLLTDIILDGGREQGRTSRAELVGVKKGQLILLSGAVIQNNDNIDTAEGAGGLRVINGQAIVSTGSVIRNCRGLMGGGAAVAGSGAALAIDGGVIEDCEAFLGGGVYIHNNGPDSLGQLYLQNGGIIRRNKAKETMEGMNYVFTAKPGYGGGIYMERGQIIMPWRNSGGTVEGNYAEKGGGGIYVLSGTLNMYSGTVTGNYSERHSGGIVASPYAAVALGDTATVTGNTSAEAYCYNLHLDNEEGISEDSTKPVLILMPLTASVGISRRVQPDQDHPYRIVAIPGNGPHGKHTITEDDLAKFYSDDPKYTLLLESGNIVLTVADVVFDNQGHGVRPASQHLDNSTHLVEDPGELTERGYEFGGWFKDEDCTEGNEWDFKEDKIINLDEAKPLVTLYAKWDLIHYPIAYELVGGENNADNPLEYTVESDDITLKEPRKVGCRFLGWKEEILTQGASLLRGGAHGPEALDASDGPGVQDADPDIPHGSIGERKFVAQWEDADPCTVTYTDGAGGAAFAEQEHRDLELWADTPAFSGTPTRPGYTFTGWSPEVTDKVEGDTVYTAQWGKNPPPQPPSYYPDPPIYIDPPAPSASPEPSATPEPPEPSASPEPETPYIPPELESRDHFAYIVGFSDGTVRPGADITRSEAVSIFYRLMTDEFRSANRARTNPFPDVGFDDWYNNAVSTAYRAGLVSGLPDGTFGGGRSITRGEFAAIAARFLSDEIAPDSGFPDLEGHWARLEADRAVAAGWMNGFPDGCFHPDDPITRAEVMTLVNRMLGRVPRAGGMLEGMAVWPDNPEDAWYYADVQEATNSHAYERSGHGPETWTALTENRDWTQLEQPPEP